MEHPPENTERRDTPMTRERAREILKAARDEWMHRVLPVWDHEIKTNIQSTYAKVVVRGRGVPKEEFDNYIQAVKRLEKNQEEWMKRYGITVREDTVYPERIIPEIREGDTVFSEPDLWIVGWTGAVPKASKK